MSSKICPPRLPGFCHVHAKQENEPNALLCMDLQLTKSIVNSGNIASLANYFLTLSLHPVAELTDWLLSLSCSWGKHFSSLIKRQSSQFYTLFLYCVNAWNL